MRIKYRLGGAMLATSVLAALVTGVVAYEWGARLLERKAFDQLTSLQAAKVDAVQTYFKTLRNETACLSRGPGVAAALRDLSAAFESTPQNENSDASLKIFYEEEFLPRVLEKSGQKVKLEDVWPKLPGSRTLQNIFIAKNPYPPGRKQQLLDADYGGKYSEAHRRYHGLFREFIKSCGFYDLFLVDAKTGDVVYSVIKETDFGTNLKFGVLKDSSLAEAFIGGLSATNEVFQTRFKSYLPSYGGAAAFLSSPIIENNSAIGVLVVQVPPDEVDRVMTNNRRWEEDGLGKTGETYIVGPDHLMRNDSRFLLETPELFFADLVQTGVNAERIKQMRNLNSTILLHEVHSPAADKALKGESGTMLNKDYRGIEVLSSYAPIQLGSVPCGLVAKIDAAEAFAPVHRLGLIVLLVVIGVGVVVSFVSLAMAGHFTRPIETLVGAVHRFGGGDSATRVTLASHDEFGDLGEHFNRMAQTVEENRGLLLQKMRENEQLLQNVLPGAIADRLKSGEELIADSYAEVSILFADIVGFTAMSSKMLPSRLLDLLNSLFTEFDLLAQKHSVEKIKTIGDAYMAASGLPVPDEKQLEHIIEMALGMLQAVEKLNRERDTHLAIRIGVHTGPVVAGVIGKTKFIYDLWGDTVNIASRLESTGVPGAIHVTEAVQDALRGKYNFTAREPIEMRGKGKVTTYLLVPEETHVK